MTPSGSRWFVDSNRHGYVRSLLPVNLIRESVLAEHGSEELNRVLRMYLHDRSFDRVGGDVTVSAACGLALATLGGDRENADSVDLLDGSLDLSLGGSSIDFEGASIGFSMLST